MGSMTITVVGENWHDELHFHSENPNPESPLWLQHYKNFVEQDELAAAKKPMRAIRKETH